MSLFDYCAVTCIWCPNMSQLRIMERLHSKVTLSVSHILKKLSTCFCYTLLERRRFHSLCVSHIEEIIYMFLLYFTGTSTFSLSYTTFCIEFLLLTCFIYFTMQKM